jgi:hypothetical protein
VRPGGDHSRGRGGALKAMHKATDGAVCDHEKEHTTQQAGAVARGRAVAE